MCDVNGRRTPLMGRNARNHRGRNDPSTHGGTWGEGEEGVGGNFPVPVLFRQTSPRQEFLQVAAFVANEKI